MNSHFLSSCVFQGTAIRASVSDMFMESKSFSASSNSYTTSLVFLSQTRICCTRQHKLIATVKEKQESLFQLKIQLVKWKNHDVL